jgi:hypothetical protein
MRPAGARTSALSTASAASSIPACGRGVSLPRLAVQQTRSPHVWQATRFMQHRGVLPHSRRCTASGLSRQPCMAVGFDTTNSRPDPLAPMACESFDMCAYIHIHLLRRACKHPRYVISQFISLAEDCAASPRPQHSPPAACRIGGRPLCHTAPWEACNPDAAPACAALCHVARSEHLAGGGSDLHLLHALLTRLGIDAALLQALHRV